MESHELDRSLTEKEAADILGISPITLRKQRCVGQCGDNGIPVLSYYRYGARTIRYSLKEVLAWKEALRVTPAAADNSAKVA